MAPRILAVAGSTRPGSYNGWLLAQAVAGAERAGADVTTVDLGKYQLPLFDSGAAAPGAIPPAAAHLKAMVRGASGIILASPEYNGAMPPVLLNLIAWTTRAERGEVRGEVYQGKAAALLSASPEPLGGMRALAQLSSVLAGLGVLVMPYPLSVPDAATAFTADGRLVDKKMEARVLAAGEALAKLLGRLRAPGG